MVDFDQLQNSLQQFGANCDASEAHGTLSGLLIGRHDFSKWLSFTLEQPPDKSDLLGREVIQSLQQLFDEVKVQLNDEDMSFELILPGEEQEFALRLIGLANWCQGFLYGIAVSGESLVERLSEQGRECMDDLLQISQLSHDEEQNEETEMVYAEIVEHVRMSVIFLNEEINPLTSSAQVH